MTALVGRSAPDFSCAAVLADGSIVEDFQLSKVIAGKYGLLVFYPLDFTFVCPSELIALDHRALALRERNVEVTASRSTRSLRTTPGVKRRSSAAASAKSVSPWPPM